MTDQPHGRAGPLSLRRKLLYSIFIVVISFGGAELGLRLVFPVMRSVTLPDEMIEAHLVGGGMRYDPDLMWYWSELPMGSGHDSQGLNQYGFRRTAPMTVEKPAGVVRVFTFGDSQTWGAGVKASESYSAFAEAELGAGWEVINAGISGYRSLNVYRFLRLHIERFEPDIIVVDCMAHDSPKDDQSLLVSPGMDAGYLQHILWESRLYYLLRLAVTKARAAGLKLAGRTPGRLEGGTEGLGNHDLIRVWGEERGIPVVFMEYTYWDQPDGGLMSTSPATDLPAGTPVIIRP